MAKTSGPVRVGVIGAGGIGQAHMAQVAAAGGQLVAVADVNSGAAEASAKKFNIPNVFADFTELLKMKDLDAVTVALPNYLHAPVCIAALKAGKHVMCEKPMAMSVGECKKVNEAAGRAGKVLQIGLHQRYQAESQVARRLVAEGKLGEIYHAVAFATRRRGVPGRGGWFTTKAKSGGGPLIDIGVHIMDLTCWIMGQPRPVAISAQTYQKFIHRDDYAYVSMWTPPVPGGPTDVEDYVTALVRFENGATCTLECAWAANINENVWQSQILGDKAGLLVKPGASLVLSGQDGSLLTDVTPLYRKADPQLEQFKVFLRCCQTGEKPMTTGQHGQYTQAILDGIYRSAAAGREVAIKPSDLPAKL